MIRLLLLTLILLTSFYNIQPHTNKGIVYFSFDNGKTWENKGKGLPNDIFLSDIAVGPNFLGLATKQNGIFTFEYQTNQWKEIDTVPIEDDEINALYFYQEKIFVGTKNNGIFISPDKGKNWTLHNNGLKNLTIRKFIALDNKLYVGTNDGLYIFDELTKKWKLEYGQNMLQVNGIKEFDGEIYIGTNQGAFKKNENEWKQIMPNRSLHNIGADRKNIYALTYNELFVSSDKGISWRSDQQGMPVGMYSFQIIEKDNTVLAGQWDGVYIRTNSQGWKLTNNGMPANFPVTELVVSGNIIVAGSSQWINE